MDAADAGAGKGRIVLATVKGDVHDIGKNLVDIILTNNGYEVHNLGIKIAIGDMIEKAKEVKADAIGMSGLLVKSTLIMRDNLQELNSRELSEIPILLGGAALTRVLRRARPARHLRGPRVLRQGRLRGPPRHGQARRHPAGRRGRRPRLGPGAVGVAGAEPGVAGPGREGGGRPVDTPRPLARRRRRQRGVHPAVRRARRWSRASPSTTSPGSSTRPPCSATSGSSAPRRARTTTSSRRGCGPRSAASWPRPRPRAC